MYLRIQYGINLQKQETAETILFRREDGIIVVF